MPRIVPAVVFAPLPPRPAGSARSRRSSSDWEFKCSENLVLNYFWFSTEGVLLYNTKLYKILNFILFAPKPKNLFWLIFLPP